MTSSSFASKKNNKPFTRTQHKPCGMAVTPLKDTQVTDKALRHLEGLTKLEYLVLSGTHVTGEGAEELRKALQNCHIYCDEDPKN